MVAERKSVNEFGAKELLANAQIYRVNKRVVDGASSYDNLDDAIAGLTEAWKALEAQVESGSGYTPDAKLGFGSDNAAVIAESILGRRNSVGSTRKQFNALGK
jgi:hypothetical protein